MSELISAETVLDALQHCCADEFDRRKSLEKPFRDGEYILGTDGKIAVRYKIPKEDYSKFPEEVEDHPGIAKVFPGYDNTVKFSAESIQELKDRYADWCKLIQEGIKKNPDNLEECHCPCCKSRLYRKGCGEELLDADEYDEAANRLHGIVLRMQDGSQFFLRAYTLSKFLHFISVLGYNDIPTLYVRPYGDRYAYLLSKDGGWDAIMMLCWYDNDKDIDYKPIGKVLVKGD